MKKILFLFIAFLFLFSYANEGTLEKHYRIFHSSPDVLFMEAVSVLNESNYEISEIQSQNGYILFSAGSKFFLLTVTRKYQNQTEIKILPQNSNYSGSEEIVMHIFTLIDNKIKTKPLMLVK